ncbi:MAG: hypothetical protein AB1649_14235 [Chloroflexota bacterium]
MDSIPYIPGTIPANRGPLARFLPPIEEGTISAWLGKHAKLADWLLDPFGYSPRLVLEAARAGHRVLVTSNNPITRFLLEMAASAPTEAELKSALAELGASRKGEERLETHLQNLYLTPCEKCGREVQAQFFLWRKGEEAPYARVYECPHCEDKGERPSTAVDIERSLSIGKSASLHRARVLERVAPLDDPDREYAEEALQVYLPRAIYALATLINRMDGLNTSAERKRLMVALALVACDAANSLHSPDRPRPKQLTASNQFRENNAWMALEAGINLFSETGSRVPFEAWPKKIPEGGISIFDGRVKTLAEQVHKEIPIAAIIGAIPRPNQAFWTLSALWSGWLWGREAAEPFKIGLRRRRYDWAWSATALESTFHHLFDLLPLGTPMFGLMTQAEPQFLTSTLTAASVTGFDLSGLAIRTQLDPMQISWTRGEHLKRETHPADLDAVRRAISIHLNRRGEPSTYLHVHAAGLSELAGQHALKDPKDELDEALKRNNMIIADALTGEVQFLHYGSGDNAETGLWGLEQYEKASLADQVEMHVVNFLQKNPDSIFLEIEDNLYAQFPGLLTPSKALAYQVLNSYAIREKGVYRLRDEDKPSLRRDELSRISGWIETIGQRIGYSTRKEDRALIWEESGEVVRVFYVLASGLVGRMIRENKYPAEKCLLVLPGGRAALVAYKQTRDPMLAKMMHGWRIVKFRLIRQLADIPVLTRETFEEQISSDPVEKDEGQLMMF